MISRQTEGAAHAQVRARKRTPALYFKHFFPSALLLLDFHWFFMLPEAAVVNLLQSFLPRHASVSIASCTPSTTATSDSEMSFSLMTAVVMGVMPGVGASRGGGTHNPALAQAR